MDMDSRDDLKDTLRKEIVWKRRGLTKAYREDADRRICERILSLPEYRKAKTIFTFVGTKDEIDTTCLIETALEAGKRVGVPRSQEQGLMEVFAITSLSDLIPGRFGIREPREGTRRIPIEEIDFCVIPCVACDLEGNRLGHGGGYYDRYLSRRRMETAVVCYHELVLPEVPVLEHDVRVDRVVTEQVVVDLREMK